MRPDGSGQAHATLHETLAVEMTDRQQALSDLRSVLKSGFLNQEPP